MGHAAASIQPVSWADCNVPHRVSAVIAVIAKAKHDGEAGCNGSTRQSTGQTRPGAFNPEEPATWRADRAGQEGETLKQSRKSRPLNLPGSASEDAFHLAVAELLDWVLRMPTFWTTFPAGYGKLGKGMAGKLKAKGLKAGMPDILIFHPVPPHINNSHVVGLELKAGRNTTSSAQRNTHQLLWAAGVKVYTIRNLNDVLAALLAENIPFKQIELHDKVKTLEREVIVPTQTSMF